MVVAGSVFTDAEASDWKGLAPNSAEESTTTSNSNGTTEQLASTSSSVPISTSTREGSGTTVQTTQLSQYRFLTNELPPDPRVRWALALAAAILLYLPPLALQAMLIRSRWRPGAATAVSLCMVGLLTTATSFVLLSEVSVSDYRDGFALPWWQDWTDWLIALGCGSVFFLSGVVAWALSRSSAPRRVTEE